MQTQPYLVEREAFINGTFYPSGATVHLHPKQAKFYLLNGVLIDPAAKDRPPTERKPAPQAPAWLKPPQKAERMKLSSRGGRELPSE